MVFRSSVDRSVAVRGGVPTVSRLFITVAVLLCAAGCEQSEPSSTTTKGDLLSKAAKSQEDTARAREEDPYAGSASRFGRVVLHAGFSPDPRIVAGQAAGEVRASTIHEKCEGWVSKKPDFLLEATTAFYKMHVLAHAKEDVLVVVRLPDGKVRCNDNRRGQQDPMVHASFGIGTSQVWVGVHRQGASADFRLAFSEVQARPTEIEWPR